jgi:hypothetical protein
MNNFSNGTTSLKATGKGEKPEGMLIIVDEASMVNQDLLDTIREETAATCKVLYIGDPYQLPPVGETTCPVFSQVRLKAHLTTIQRNPGPIAELGAKFREAVSTGVFPNIVATPCESVMTVDGPTFQAMVNTEFANRADCDHARILAWTNGTVHGYNEYVRSIHTESPMFEIGETVVTNKPILEKKSTAYSTDSTAVVTSVGVMTVERDISGYWIELDRNLKVFQPQDQWRVKAVTKKLSRAKQWTEFFATQDFFADLRAIHSSTAHKCQGATVDIAFIDLNDIGQCRDADLVARILYVVSTRPRTKVVFYGKLPAKYGG